MSAPRPPRAGARDAGGAYNDPAYRRNRPLVLAAEPWCPGWPRGRHDCPACGAPYDQACPHRERVRTTSADHIDPVARGGTNARANLRGLCGPCNSRRGQAQARRRPRHVPPPRDVGGRIPRVWREV